MSVSFPGQETLVALVTRACPLDCVYCQFRRDPPPMDDALLRRCADLVLEAAFERLVRRRADFSVHMVVSPEGVGDFRADALRYLERGAPQVHVQYRVGVRWPRERALALYPDDPEKDAIVRDSLAMGDACLEAAGVLRRRLEAERARR